MTAPAGPEEVREPDFEQAQENALALLRNHSIEREVMTGRHQCGCPECQTARAYVALQARVKELKPWIQHMLDCDKNVASMDGGISHFDNEQACTCGLAEALSRLAKLEQERGRGEG